MRYIQLGRHRVRMENRELSNSETGCDHSCYRRVTEQFEDTGKQIGWICTRGALASM